MAAQTNGVKSEADPHEINVRRVYSMFKRMTEVRNENLAYGPFTRRGVNSRSSQADRTLAEECGYPGDPDLDARYFMNAYRRWGIARRVNDIWPDESWAAYPRVSETEDKEPTAFEKALSELDARVLLYANLHKADRLSGIGRFGVLFLGFDDGYSLSRPPPGIDADTGEPRKDRPPRKPLKLNYARPFDETLVKVETVEVDPRNPRYGLPTSYTVQFDATMLTDEPGSGAAPAEATATGGLVVHWTRIQHLADNTTSSLVWGQPRMEPVIDHLHDLRKVAGSSAEMFYKGGFPGYAFEGFPDQIGMSNTDIDSLREDMTAYQEGLQRFLASEGGSWKSLQPQVANPGPHVQVYGSLICTTIGTPTRIFFGSEEGHLASTQDDDTWRRRLKGRQTRYLEPVVLRPLLDRLVKFGVLPKAEAYTVEWLDLRSLSEADRAEVALKRVQTLMQYMTGDVRQVLPVEFLYTTVMGWTDEQAAAVLRQLELDPPPTPILQQQMELQKETAKATMEAKRAGGSGGGSRSGNPAKKRKGRPVGKVEGRP